MTLKLYGYPASSSARIVAMTLVEKKVPFEFVTVAMEVGEHKSPAFLEKQPFGQIPIIDDDGFILYESRAICRYIALKYADQGTRKLIPTDSLREIALFEQAASIEQNNFNEYARTIVYELVAKPKYTNEEPDKAVVDKSIATLSSKLDVYDAILGKQKYLAGNEITLADLFHLPLGTMLATAGTDVLDSKPNVARWFKDISSRESWIAYKDGVQSTA